MACLKVLSKFGSAIEGIPLAVTSTGTVQIPVSSVNTPDSATNAGHFLFNHVFIHVTPIG